MTLLPPNATKLEKAMEGVIGRVSDLPVPLRELWSPQNCPAEFLPWLAWAFRVDFWRDDLPEEVKRNLVFGSISWHRKKGTPKAIVDGLAMLGFRSRVIEWWDLGTEPHTFGIRLEGMQEARIQEVREMIALAKAERSHLVGMDLCASFSDREEVLEHIRMGPRFLLEEKYPWPGLCYDGTHVYLPTYALYDGRYQYNGRIRYGDILPGSLCYGCFEKADEVGIKIHHGIEEFVFSLHLYGEEGSAYDGSRSYGADATLNDSGPVQRFRTILCEEAIPAEQTSMCPLCGIAEKTETGDDGLAQRTLMSLTEKVIPEGSIVAECRRQPLYDETVRYGEEYGGRTVCYGAES